jgi:hypothetical protein
VKGEAGLTWAEQEIIGALRRLARAQAQVDDIRARRRSHQPRTFDPADVERLEQLQAQLTVARIEASGRFVKGATRQALRDLERAERRVLDRLQMATYDDYRARVQSLASSEVPVEPAMAAFADRELEAAWAEWRAVRSLPAIQVPVDDADEAPEPVIDLTTSG